MASDGLYDNLYDQVCQSKSARGLLGGIHIFIVHDVRVCQNDNFHHNKTPTGNETNKQEILKVVESAQSMPGLASALAQARVWT